MGDRIRCNICFRKPGWETTRFVITNCGHVLCERCLRKGKNEICAVCKNACRTIILNNETDPEVKMLFMDIGDLCKKFSKEFTQVAEFQASHRHRLLAHYKKRIAKLEETIKELTQQLQSCSLRPSPSYSRQSGCSTLKNMDLSPVHPEDRYSPSASQLPSSQKTEFMDFTSSAPIKNNMTITGPGRLTLISPPLNAFMGPYRSNSAERLSRSSVGSSQHSIFHQRSQPVSPANQESVWSKSSQRSPNVLSLTPTPSQMSSARRSITLANILQRRH